MNPLIEKAKRKITKLEERISNCKRCDNTPCWQHQNILKYKGAMLGYEAGLTDVQDYLDSNMCVGQSSLFKQQLWEIIDGVKKEMKR